MKLFEKLFRTEADFPAPRYPDRKSRIHLLILGSAALLLAVIAIVFRACSGQEKRLQDTVNALYAEEEAELLPPEDTAIEQFQPLQADFERTRRGELILVNRAHPYHPQKEDEERLLQLLSLTGEDYFVTDWSVRLEENAAKALERAMAATRKSGVPRSVLADRAYRTPEEQLWVCQQYYHLEDGETLSAPEDEVLQVCAPNASDYQTGLSVHLSFYGGGKMDGSPYQVAVTAAMEQEGFCLRYAEEKEAKTKVKANAGQFRYVGRPHAAYMAHHGLCLEEYIALLQKKGQERKSLHIQADGKEYCVYHIRAAEKETPVPVPTGYSYTLSGDNCGGFIVTVCLTK